MKNISGMEMLKKALKPKKKRKTYGFDAVSRGKKGKKVMKKRKMQLAEKEPQQTKRLKTMCKTHHKVMCKKCV